MASLSSTPAQWRGSEIKEENPGESCISPFVCIPFVGGEREWLIENGAP